MHMQMIGGGLQPLEAVPDIREEKDTERADRE